jgi:menaquinone-dependent protoporphyrinogen oxidase
MSTLVAYASKHGATGEIAERIADTLRRHGLVVDLQPIQEVHNPRDYDAFVLGSAVYLGSWLKSLTRFLQEHRAVLARRPVWLFSSGPLGTSPADSSAPPKELAAVAAAVAVREHRMFAGALDHTSFDLSERLLWALPAGRKLLVEGDYRNWTDIGAWADGIAAQLAPEKEHATNGT